MNKSLLIQAIPYVGESAASYLARTAELNGYQSVYQLFGKERLNYLTKKAPNCDLTDLPRFKFALQIFNINPNYEKLAFSRSGRTSRSAKKWGELEISENLLTHHEFSYCPKCLSEEPFFRKIWLFKPIYACPKHSIVLLNSCRKCGKKIDLISGVKYCCSCGFKFASARSKACKSYKEIEWFIDIINHNSNDFFQQFSSYWLALDKLAKLSKPLTNEQLLTMTYEYFHTPHNAANTLSNLINERIKLYHPRIQLLPFLKYGELFQKYVSLVESKCHPYRINSESCSIILSNLDIRQILGLSRKSMDNMIEKNFLNFKDINQYNDYISSSNIEKFLTEEPLMVKPSVKIIFKHSPHPENLCLKRIANYLEVNYETARKLAKNHWFDN